MKITKITISIFIILSMFIIVSCGKDKVSEPEVIIPPEAVDTWTYQSATMNGNPVSLDFVLEWQDGTISARFTIDSDGSFLEEELDNNNNVIWTKSGAIEFNGNNFNITLTSNDEGPINPAIIRIGTWAINGNQLTITIVEDQYTIVFIATK